MEREIKFEIMLRALENTQSGHSKGDEVKMINDIFCRKNGVAFWQIGLEWEIVYKRQYTGLKDKNGVDIYEGDIVEFKLPDTPNDEGERGIGVIEYESVGTRFVINEWAMGESQWDIHNIHEDIRITVKGNIHQNPELLNTK